VTCEKGHVALTYVTRRGDTYYLHAGKTKTGKPRYFVAKTVGVGALDTMPPGFELTESVNGVVSVRRIDPDAPTVPDGDVELVRAELGRHAHLRSHRAEVVDGEIVIFEPDRAHTLDEFAAMAGMSRRLLEERLGGRLARTRYTPIMKFVPGGLDDYNMRRMTYRGSGGWSWPLAQGSLEKLAKKHIRLIGTDEFFELL